MSRDAADIAGTAHARPSIEAWKIAAPVAIAVLIGVFLLFWETVAFTVDFWSRRRAYGHGLLLVPISLFMIWHTRAALSRVVPGPQPWGAPFIVALSLAWALAYFIDVQLGMQLTLLATMGAVLWTLLGNRAAWLLAFPVAYLLLGIPVWSLLTPILQENTATISTAMLRAIGVPVYLEAFYISIPSGQFVVEEVCAGLRYLLATMSIAALYAYLNLRPVWLGAVFFLCCTVFSIALNWLRVVIIIWVGHATSMQHWLVNDHLTFGWIMFAVGLIPIFAFGVWLQRFYRAPAIREPAATGGAPAGARTFVVWGLAALVLSGVGPALVLWNDTRVPGPVSAELQAPAAVAPWRIAATDEIRWEPRYVGADASLLSTYRDGGGRVDLFIAYYAHQRDGAEVVNELNVLYDEKRWKRRRVSQRRVPFGDDGQVRLREIQLVTSSGARRLVWFWYRVGDRRITGVLEAKLTQVWAILSGSPAAAVAAVSTPVEGGLDAARARLEAYLQAMGPAVTTAIERAGAR